MSGIKVSQTFDTIWMLPKITKAVAAVINKANTQLGVSGKIAANELEIAEV